MWSTIQRDAGRTSLACPLQRSTRPVCLATELKLTVAELPV
jgi:hypothetical protein